MRVGSRWRLHLSWFAQDDRARPARRASRDTDDTLETPEKLVAPAVPAKPSWDQAYATTLRSAGSRSHEGTGLLERGCDCLEVDANGPDGPLRPFEFSGFAVLLPCSPLS